MSKLVGRIFYFLFFLSLFSMRVWIIASYQVIGITVRDYMALLQANAVVYELARDDTY
jgi:hypothetical protein